MLTLKKFGFFFELEIAGLFVGWCSIITSIVLGGALITLASRSFEHLCDYINDRFGVQEDSIQFPITSKVLSEKLNSVD